MTSQGPWSAQERDGCVLALDGGGTKTLVAVVARDGQVRGLRREAGVNPFDGPEWRPGLIRCLGDLPDGIVACGFGLAGYGEDRVMSAALREVVHTAVPCPLIVFGNDVEFACAGAFAGAPGTLLLAGTGSMAWRNTPDGHTHRVGGFGALFGDEGSAYWIGQKALSWLSQALDGRRPLPDDERSALLSLLGITEDAADPSAELLAWYAALTSPRAQVAALAAGIDQLAVQSVPVACLLLDEAAAALGAHLVALHGKHEAIRWSHGGSVFRSRHVLARLAARFGPPRPPALPPIGGSALIAARAAGWVADDAWVARLATSLAESGIT